jgi:nitronate monooxygenase
MTTAPASASAPTSPFASVSEATKRLGLAHPIVQGPFGGGLSTVELAATVSNLGGLGSYGAQVLPPAQILEITAQLRERTARPFAINLWISSSDMPAEAGGELSIADFDRFAAIFEPYFRELGLGLPAPPTPPARYGQRFEEQIEALLEARPPVFSFVFGIPSPAILAECRRRGIITIGAATSVAEACALEAAGVDALVATGAEAGGHRPTFLGRAEDALIGTFALVQLVSARVTIPVIAAGGIADRRGVDAAFALGAGAAQLGTAFLACAESGASPLHRQLMFSERAAATTLTRAFTGRLARGLVNRMTRELGARTGELAPFPVQGWFVSQLRRAALAKEDPELLAMGCGQIAPTLRHRSAAELFASLIA